MPGLNRECSRCRRPSRVCLCEALPADSLTLRGKLVVLQHPYELRRRLTSVPLLELCLADACLVLRGRTFPAGRDSPLGAVLGAAQAACCPVFVLFPTHSSANLAAVCAELAACSSAAAGEQQSGPAPALAYVLIAIDGTWRQAKELFKKLAGAVDAWNMQVVHLPHSTGVDASERECLVRREPAPGCVMTAEAVGRALGLLEGSARLQEALLAPLRRMTALQAQFDPATATRLQCGSELLSRSKKCFGFRMPPAAAG